MIETPSPAPAAPLDTPRPLASRHTLGPRIKTLPPLSPVTYYRRNVWRTLPVGGAIVISVFLIAAIVTLLNSVDESIATNYGFVRSFSVLATQLEKDVPARTLAQAKKNPHLGRVIEGVPYLLPISTVFGEMPVPVYGVDAPDMPRITQASGNHLTEGSRFPTPGEPEIVLSRTWANNLHKRLGQKIVIDNERLPSITEPQKVVGILEGGENVAITSRDYLILSLPDPVVRTSYLMVPKTRAEMGEMNKGIRDIVDNYKKHGLTKEDVRFVHFYTFDGLVSQLRRSLGFLYKFLALADVLVIGAVALLSGFLANIYFEQRLGEFGLLSAFGFRRERLARRLLIETGALVVFGWVAGLAMTWLIFRALDYFYMSPRGLIIAHLDSLALRYTLPTPILVGAASLATVLIRLYRLDPIEIMERR